VLDGLRGRAVEVPGGGLGGDGGFAGFSPRDFVLGTSNDLRWVDMLRADFQFYALPGKLDAAHDQDRMHKLLQPYGRGKPRREVERGSLSWNLALPIDEAAAKRAEKAIAKLDGVQQAHIDARRASCRCSSRLEGLHASAPPLPGAHKAGRLRTRPRLRRLRPSKLPARARASSQPDPRLLIKEKIALPAPAPADPAAVPPRAGRRLSVPTSAAGLRSCGPLPDDRGRAIAYLRGFRPRR
jgi:hypothetical protein